MSNGEIKVSFEVLRLFRLNPIYDAGNRSALRSLATSFARGLADDLDEKDTAFLTEVMFRYGEVTVSARLAQRRAFLEYPVTAFDTLASQYDRLLTYDLVIPKSRRTAFVERPSGREQPKVLSFVYDALSFHNTGYTIRTQRILENTSLPVSVYTRIGFPWIGGLLKTNAEKHTSEFKAIKYHHRHGRVNNQNETFTNIGLAKHAIKKIILAEQPDIVHAASNFVNALPALLAARECGVPFVYEMRGFWEMTAGVGVAGWFESERFALETRIETLIVRSSDRVIVLSEGQRQLLIERGASNGLIRVVANHCDATDFTAEPSGLAAQHSDLRARLKSGRVIGYLGSIAEYEGLQDLVRVLARPGALSDVRLVIVGEGPYLSRLKQLVAELGLSERVLLVGGVPSSEVRAFYDLVDLCVLPRLPNGVAELVPPLKFIEILARGKVLLASNVAAMAEVAHRLGYGELFRAGDLDDLEVQIARILDDLPSKKERYRTAAGIIREKYSWRQGGAVWDDAVASAYQSTQGEVPETALAAVKFLYDESDRRMAKRLQRWRRLGRFAIPPMQGHVVLRAPSVDLAALKILIVRAGTDVAEICTPTVTTRQPNVVLLDLGGKWTGGETLFIYAREDSFVGSAASNWVLYDSAKGGTTIAGGKRLGRFSKEAREILAVELEHSAQTQALLQIQSHYDEPVKIAYSFIPLPGAKLAESFGRLAVSGTIGARFQYGTLSPGSNECTVPPRLTGPFMLEITPWQGSYQYEPTRIGELRAILTLPRDSASLVVLPKHRINVLVAADLSENLLDGSVIWLSTLVQQIAADPTINVFVATNAIHTPNSISAEFLNRENVAKIDLELQGPKRTMDMASRLQEIDRVSGGFDAIVVRGDELARLLSTKPLRNRIIYYGVGIATPYNVSDGVLRDPEAAKFISKSAGIIVQNGLVRNVLSATFPLYCGAFYVIPPCVDETSLCAADANSVRGIEGGPLVVYAGKLERKYGVLEFMSAIEKLAMATPNVKAVVLGNKFDARDPTFASEFSEWRERLGDALAWLPAVSRTDALAWTKAADAVWGWRHGEFEMSHFEISTKMIEAICCETPIVLYPSPANVEVLGSNYSGFASSPSEAMDALLGLIRSGRERFRFETRGIADSFLAANAYRPLLDCIRAMSRERARSSGYVTSEVKVQSQIVQRRPRVLVASHDFRFFEDIEAELLREGIPVHRQYWRAHQQLRTTGDERIVDYCDVILSEWGLGNAVWWSNNLEERQRLVIRMHLQELQTEFPALIDYRKVSKVIFVSPHVMRIAQQKFNIPREICAVIPIGVPFDPEPPFSEAESKARRNVLGMVGITPWRKRPDRALDLLGRLRRRYPDLQLYFKGAMPSDYSWMSSRGEEVAEYQRLFHEVAELQAKGIIRFQPYDDEMESFYRGVGWILSLSDFEGIHTAVAEGGLMGCLPLMTNWPGADEIYDPGLVQEDLEGAEAFFDTHYGNFHDASVALQDTFRQQFATDIVYPMWRSVLLGREVVSGYSTGEAVKPAKVRSSKPSRVSSRKRSKADKPEVPGHVA